MSSVSTTNISGTDPGTDHDFGRPSGTGVFLYRYPGTSYLATITLSLRDKSRSSAEALLKLTLMGARPYQSQLHRANQIGKLQASSPRCSPHVRSGSNPRLLCLTNIYFGQQWISSIFDLSLAHGDFSTLVQAAFCCSNIQNTFREVSAGHQNKGFPIFCTLNAIGKCPVSFNGDSALP